MSVCMQADVGVCVTDLRLEVSVHTLCSWFHTHSKAVCLLLPTPDQRPSHTTAAAQHKLCDLKDNQTHTQTLSHNEPKETF